MISKEEFKRELKKEISLLNATGELAKIKEKQYKPYTLYLQYFCLFCVVFFFIILSILEPAAIFYNDPMKEKHPVIIGTMIFFAFIGLCALAIHKNKNDFRFEKGKKLQPNFDKLLHLLGVKIVTKKRFHMFSGLIGIRKPHASPAYQVGNLIIQNFIERGTRQHNYCRKAEILIYFNAKATKNSYFFRNLNFFNPKDAVYKIGKQLSDRFPHLFCYAYSQGNNQQICLEYDYDPNHLSIPCFLLDKTLPYNLFLSSNFETFANRLYNDVSFLNELSQILDKGSAINY